MCNSVKITEYDCDINHSKLKNTPKRKFMHHCVLMDHVAVKYQASMKEFPHLFKYKKKAMLLMFVFIIFAFYMLELKFLMQSNISYKLSLLRLVKVKICPKVKTRCPQFSSKYS